MALADFEPERDHVTFKGGSFEVRGFSLTDISSLVRNNLAELRRAFDLYETDDKAGVTPDQIVVRVVTEMPTLVSRIIAIASDEPDQEAKAGQLPFPLQIDAVIRILSLTFEEVGGPKKFLQTVVGAARDLGLSLPTILSSESTTESGVT